MSEILIKGMKVKDYPQTITINPDGSVIKDTFGLHRLVKEWKAIKVPPHGRLIQAEEVKKLLNSGLSLDTYEDQAYVCSLINEIPTIIEASEERKK